MILHRSLTVESGNRIQIQDLTENVNKLLKSNEVSVGLVSLFCVHTTAALSVNENDEDLWVDLINKFSQFAPREGEYKHRPNAYAHILGSMVKPGVTVPFVDGELSLGMWQRILFFEFDGPRKREIKVTLIGD